MLSICSIICKKTLTFLFLSFLENLYCKLLPELFLAIIKQVYLGFCSPWPCFAIHPLHSKYMSRAFLPPCISFLLPRVAFYPVPPPQVKFSIPQSPHLRLTLSCLPYPCPSLSPSSALLGPFVSATPDILPLALCFIVLIVFLNLLCYLCVGVAYILPSRMSPST